MKVVYATDCSNPTWEFLVFPVVQSRRRPRNAPAISPCYGPGTAELSSGLGLQSHTPSSPFPELFQHTPKVLSSSSDSQSRSWLFFHKQRKWHSHVYVLCYMRWSGLGREKGADCVNMSTRGSRPPQALLGTFRWLSGEWSLLFWEVYNTIQARCEAQRDCVLVNQVWVIAQRRKWDRANQRSEGENDFNLCHLIKEGLVWPIGPK